MTAETTSPPTVRSTPDLVRKEALAALGALAAVCLVSALFDAPVEGPADPQGMPPEHVKAPWIFVGIQQMLRWWSPWLAGVVVPVAAVVVLAVIPFAARSGITRTIVAVAFFLVVVLACALTLWGYFL